MTAGAKTSAVRGGNDWLNVGVLVALAVAMPLCALVRRFPEFLWSHSVSASALITLVVGLLLLPPLPLMLLLVAGRLVARAATASTFLAIGLPSGVLALQGLVSLHATGWEAVLGASALGAAAGLLYLRWPRLRSYVGLLLIVALVAPARLLWSVEPVAGKVGDDGFELGRTGNRAPIVVVVFDELPMISLLNAQGAWDERNFPNFARLAATAHSFDRASSVSAATLVSVPAILTAERPRRRAAPTAENFPRSLFTLFGGDHLIWAAEPGTDVCPSALNRWDDTRTTFDSAALVSDLWVLWRTMTWPAPWSEELPETGATWRDFADREVDDSPASDPPGSRTGRTDDFALFYDRAKEDDYRIWTARGQAFRRFVAGIGAGFRRSTEPELHFLHTMLPHGPLIYLPSGERYIEQILPRTIGRGSSWSAAEEAIALVYQRHLLQARFADRLLGEMLDRLRATDRFDRSMIVVTADHGASFRPGQARRDSEATPAEVLWVPLLIKAPGQRVPQSHRQPVETMQVLPTMLELLDLEAPWPMSAPSGLAQENVDVAAFPDDAASAMAWKESVFGSALDFDPPLRLNRHADLIGRSLESVRLSPKTRIQLVKLVPGASLIDDPESDVRPLWIDGVLKLGSQTDCCDVAFAVNGRVVAVQRSHASSRAGLVRFQVLLPETSIAPGANTLQVFVVADGVSGRRLLVPR